MENIANNTNIYETNVDTTFDFIQTILEQVQQNKTSYLNPEIDIFVKTEKSRTSEIYSEKLKVLNI